MKRSVVVGGLIAALSLSSTALAAESVAQLGAINGQVLVNQGDGFKPATPGTSLRAGDRVIVKGKKGSKAALKYADGCSVSLTPGTMATLNGATPCKAGRQAAGLIGGGAEQGDGGSTSGGGFPGKELLVVGAVALGAAGLAIQHNDDKRETPASP